MYKVKEVYFGLNSLNDVNEVSIHHNIPGTYKKPFYNKLEDVKEDYVAIYNVVTYNVSAFDTQTETSNGFEINLGTGDEYFFQKIIINDKKQKIKLFLINRYEEYYYVDEDFMENFLKNNNLEEYEKIKNNYVETNNYLISERNPNELDKNNKLYFFYIYFIIWRQPGGLGSSTQRAKLD